MNPWNLTKRERVILEVMASMADGNGKRVGKKLDLSVWTIKQHVISAKRKMGASSRLGAVLLWDRHCRHCEKCFAEGMK